MGIPALADNDCNVGALSELWLGAEPAQDFVFLNISDFGVGAGAVLGGRIYLGHDAHFAAEFGHMVVDASGPLCRCGRRGCWERFVSNAATWQRFNTAFPFTAARFERLFAAVRKGDASARNNIAETARYLSLGISNIAFALNPSEVVVAGRITAIWDLIRPGIENVFGSPKLRCTVRPPGSPLTIRCSMAPCAWLYARPSPPPISASKIASKPPPLNETPER